MRRRRQDRVGFLCVAAGSVVEPQEVRRDHVAAVDRDRQRYVDDGRGRRLVGELDLKCLRDRGVAGGVSDDEREGVRREGSAAFGIRDEAAVDVRLRERRCGMAALEQGAVRRPAENRIDFLRMAAGIVVVSEVALRNDGAAAAGNRQLYVVEKQRRSRVNDLNLKCLRRRRVAKGVGNAKGEGVR